MASPILPGTIPPATVPAPRSAPTPPSVDERANDATSERLDGATRAPLPDRSERFGLERATRATRIPADAPVGTDPEIWALLTQDERSFFSSLEPASPVTYRPGAGSAAAAHAGLRVDVRV